MLIQEFIADFCQRYGTYSLHAVTLGYSNCITSMDNECQKKETSGLTDGIYRSRFCFKVTTT